MFLVIVALLVYFLGFKEYHIRIKDTSAADRAELTKVLKFQLGMSLTEVKYIFDHTPYTIYVGKFLEAFSAKKKIKAAGADVELVLRFFWQKKVEESTFYGAEVTYCDVENLNAEAWQYLNEAIEKSVGTDEEGDEVVALASLEDAVYVDGLLDKAEEVADDPLDNDFMDKIAAIRESVGWSLRRHWTHSWILIFGVILSIFIYGSYDSNRLNAVSSAKHRLEIIENWEEADTVFAEYPTEFVYFNDIKNPKHVKSDMLCRAYEKYQTRTAWAAECKQRADTAATKDDKKSYLKYMEQSEEEAEDAMKEYKKINKMDFDDFQDMCVDEAEDRVSSARGSAFFMWFFFIAMILMIPLYIMASYQYGYIITKYQKEAKVLEKIKKAGFAVAAGLFGAGLAMQFFPSVTVKTRWSDGSTTTHTEEDPMNYAILGLKIILFVLAVLVVCVVSCFLVAYMTVTGLRRNYDWKAIYGATRDKVEDLKNKTIKK